jgi:sulfotransferase 6B1
MNGIDKILKKIGNKLIKFADRNIPSIIDLAKQQGPVFPETNPDLPIAVVNSIPKSGTHLLGKLLSLIGFIDTRIIAGDQGYYDYKEAGDWDQWEAVMNSERTIQNPKHFPTTFRELSYRLLPGQYVVAHLSTLPGNVESIQENRIRHILIVRDPRDVAVSYYRYLTYMPHACPPVAYHYPCRAIDTDSERLALVLSGIPQQNFMPNLYDNLYRHAMPWLDETNVHKVRFENLVGPEGGGSATRQQETLHGICTYLGIEHDGEKVVALANKLFGGNTNTFNKGQIGRWREEFTPRHVDLFKEICGNLLQRMGYEENNNWSL